MVLRLDGCCPCQEFRLPTSYLLLIASFFYSLNILQLLLLTDKMAPSQIQIAISSLKRLLKEEQSYYKEQKQQEASISKLENQDGSNNENHEFQLKQEVCCV